MSLPKGAYASIRQNIEGNGEQHARSMKCPVCNSPMKFEIIPQDRKKTAHTHWFICSMVPACTTKVLAHPDGSPMGKPADKATRLCRIRTHSVFDPLWEQYKGPLNSKDVRRICYEWASHILGVSKEVHIGELNENACKILIEACQGTSIEKILEWKKSLLTPEQKARIVRGFSK